MKIVSIHKNDLELITLAAANNRQAQQAIYEKFSPKMLSICRRYFSDIYLAEDAMIQAFLKVFLKISTYDASGSFEGWIKRIVVNECIDQLRKTKLETSFEELENVTDSHVELDDIYDVDQIQFHIDKLPTGCKMVFNLYAIEGFKHQEIAQMLNISVGTSKSQVAYARNQLAKAMKNNTNYETGYA